MKNKPTHTALYGQRNAACFRTRLYQDGAYWVNENGAKFFITDGALAYSKYGECDLYLDFRTMTELS